MRVLIYTADLRDKRGFKRIAKKLQKNWPGGTPLSLTCAQAILSRGLGYRDFHDVQQSAEESDSNSPSPTQNEARDRISTSIFAFCQTSKITDIEETDLDRLVKLLPLQELHAFKEFKPKYLANSPEPTVLAPPLDAARELPGSSDETSTDQASPPVNVGLKRRHSVPPLNLIDEKGLKLLWEVVQRKGSLRDQSCIAMLLQGLRPHDLKLAKSHDFSRSDSGVLMRVQFAKSSSKQAAAFLPGSFGQVVGRYIQEAGLSANDYLFSSDKDATLPMSSREMSRMIHSYLRLALADPEQRSTHKIRRSVIANTMKAGALSVSDLAGHSSPIKTIDYVKIVKMKPKN